MLVQSMLVSCYVSHGLELSLHQQVSYKLPISAHLKKPIAVATAFLGLFVLAIAGRRVDLRIHKTK